MQLSYEEREALEAKEGEIIIATIIQMDDGGDISYSKFSSLENAQKVANSLTFKAYLSYIENGQIKIKDYT